MSGTCWLDNEVVREVNLGPGGCRLHILKYYGIFISYVASSCACVIFEGYYPGGIAE